MPRLGGHSPFSVLLRRRRVPALFVPAVKKLCPPLPPGGGRRLRHLPEGQRRGQDPGSKYSNGLPGRGAEVGQEAILENKRGGGRIKAAAMLTLQQLLTGAGLLVKVFPREPCGVAVGALGAGLIPHEAVFSVPVRPFEGETLLPRRQVLPRASRPSPATGTACGTPPREFVRRQLEGRGGLEALAGDHRRPAGCGACSLDRM